jgi:hypothetical protein
MNDNIPNTINYMLLGYAMFFSSLIFYVASWFVRRRSLEKDLELLASLENKPEPAPPVEATPTGKTPASLTTP